MNTAGRQVFITGGTGSLGRALVNAFSATGHSVTFQYRQDEQKARDLSQQCGASGIRLDFLLDQGFPDKTFDIIVNNAGVNISNVLSHEVPLKSWTDTLWLNTTIPFLVVQRYLPPMMERRWGRIINISSIYGLRGVETNLPYNVSKHGLSGLTKTVAKEYAAYGITCNEICPGSMESDMLLEVAQRDAPDGNVEAYLAEIRNEIPAKRLATPEDVAQVAVFLASDAAAYINGASLVVDGGLIA